MATYTVQAPDGKTVTLEGPDGASHADVIAQAQKLYTPAAPRSYQAEAQASTGSVVGDAVAGVGAGAIHTLLGAYKLLRMVPGVGDKLPSPSDFIESLGTEPDTIAGHVGKYAEQAGEFMIPASKVGKVTEGANLITRAAAQGATSGAVRAVQTGGDVKQAVDAAALGAAGPLVAAGVSAAGRGIVNTVKNSPALAKAVPDVVGIVSPRAGNALRVAGRVASALSPDAKQAAAEVDPLLNQFAQKLQYPDFASAPKEAQTVIQQLANGARNAPPVIQPQPLPQQPPATVPPPNAVVQNGQPVAPPVIAPLPQTTAPGNNPVTAQPLTVAEQLRELVAPGAKVGPGGVATIAPEVEAEAAPVPAAPPQPRTLKTLMRDLPAGTPKAIADASYAADQNPAQAAQVYEAAGRATKAQALSTMLYDEGLSARKVMKWTPEAWKAAASDRGLPAFSKESQGEVIDALKRWRNP